MTLFFIILFWLTLLLCLATYAIYPLVVWLIGVIKPLHIEKKSFTPFVSVIIPAYNEARHIAKKIENTLAIDYPKDKMEILVGSDGSTDDISSIMERYISDAVFFFPFAENRGKTAVQNDLVTNAKGDILVFTDAASFISTEAVTALVSNFNDPRVGCVAGRMHFLGTKKNLTTQSQGLYWRYESKIRELESRLGSLIGVDGPLYAVRADDYVPLGHDMISDLLTPLLIIAQDKKAVLEYHALVEEEPTEKTTQEFNTRRRIVLRGLIGLFNHKELLNSLKHPMLSGQIFFHKILRWFVGPLVALNFLACIVIPSSSFFAGMRLMYAVFFLLAGAGWLAWKKGMKVRLLVIPYYFLLVNAAATAGILDFIRNKRVVSWKPVRE